MKIALATAAFASGKADFSAFEKMGEVNYFFKLERDEMIKLVSQCDALILNKEPIDDDFLSHCPKLKYIGTLSTGFNEIDLAACKKRGITVCNVPNYSTHSVSQHVFALLLALYNRIREYSASVDAGDWIKSETFCYFPWDTRELYGKTFGVFGLGNIGGAVAKIAEAFGAHVIAAELKPPKNCPYEIVSFEELIKRSDVLSLHCPLNKSTEKIINAENIAKMKDGAVIVNTARGGLIDEDALRDALDSGKLAGACLDVLTDEPMNEGNPLFRAPNCIITPHIAWTPLETRERLIKLAADNLWAYMVGSPINVVSK